MHLPDGQSLVCQVAIYEGIAQPRYEQVLQMKRQTLL